MAKKNPKKEVRVPEFQRLPPRKLANIVKTRSDDGTRFGFILGAGASVESGISSGQKLATIWMKELTETDANIEDAKKLSDDLFQAKKIKHTFEDLYGCWKKTPCGQKVMKKRNPEQSIDQTDDKTLVDFPSEYYSDVYKLRFHHFEEAGHACLQKEMENKEPSLGYHILAQILAQTSGHNLVVTTNFDNLTEDALLLYSSKRPLVLGHENLASFLTPSSDRPRIAKIHRNVTLQPLNDTEETKKMKREWSEALTKVYLSYAFIVVGYGGGDESLMNFLNNHANDLHGKIYWCYYEPNGEPSAAIQRFLLKTNNWLVPIQGFDPLMLELGKSLLKRNGADSSSLPESFLPSAINKHLTNKCIERITGYQSRWAALCQKPELKYIMEPLDQLEKEQREKEVNSSAWDHLVNGIRLVAENNLEEARIEFTKSLQSDDATSELKNKAIFLLDQIIKPNQPSLPIPTPESSNHTLPPKTIDELSREIDNLSTSYNASLYNDRGIQYHFKGLYKEAIKDFQHAIRLNPSPDFYEAYNNMGLSYYCLEEYSDAIAAFNCAIEINPMFANSYFHRGNVYFKRDIDGDYKKAIDDYTKAIEMPLPHSLKTADLKTALLNRAEVYRAIGETEKAEADEARADAL